MATRLQDDWLRDALQMEPESYQPAAGQTQAAAPPAAPGGAPAGDQEAPAAGSGDGGPPPAKKQDAVVSFKLLSVNTPAAADPADDKPGAEAEPAGGGAPAAEAKGGEGGKSDGALELVDKIIVIGEKVVTALASHTGVKNSGKALTVIPDGAKPSETLSGKTGSITMAFQMSDVFGWNGVDLKVGIDYMFCTVYKKRGHYLKDIRLDVQGSCSFGTTVDITAVYGTVGNTGKSPGEWDVDLLIDIKIEYNSLYVNTGSETGKIRLNAVTGATWN